MVSMCQVLYDRVKRNDGHFFVYRKPLNECNGYGEGLYPQQSRGGNMVELMNKNIVGYLRNYLTFVRFM